MVSILKKIKLNKYLIKIQILCILTKYNKYIDETCYIKIHLYSVNGKLKLKQKNNFKYSKLNIIDSFLTAKIF